MKWFLIYLAFFFGNIITHFVFDRDWEETFDSIIGMYIVIFVVWRAKPWED